MIVFICTILFWGVSQKCFADSTIKVETQTPEFYVNDFANLFTEEQKQEIISKAVELNDTYNGIQVVVSTVETLQGNEIEEYAYSMYNQYGIGKDSMGILILLSTTDRDVRIETGYNMQKYITDSMSGRILDKYGMDYFRTNDFAQGLISVQSGMINEIKEKVPNDWETVENTSINSESAWKVGKAILIIFAIFLGGVPIVFAIINIADIMGNKPKKKSKKELMLEERDNEWKEKLNQKQAEYENSKRKFKNEIANKDDIISRFKNSNLNLEKQISEYEEKLRRIKKIHPNIDKEIQKQIDDENRKKALEWDYSVNTESRLEASELNVNTFKNIIDSYNNLPNEQRVFVKTDIEDIKCKYTQSVILKDIAIAAPIASLILACCNKFQKGDHSNYSEIANVFDKLNDLTDSQKNTIPNNNLSKFMRLYKNSSEDNENYIKAKEVEELVRDTLDRIGTPDRDDLSRLKDAKSHYSNLSDEQKAYFPQKLYDELIRKLREAEDDEAAYRRRKREEAEERRRYNSSSSSSSSSTFHGNGGSSGGGGASRHF